MIYANIFNWWHLLHLNTCLAFDKKKHRKEEKESNIPRTIIISNASRFHSGDDEKNKQEKSK